MRPPPSPGELRAAVRELLTGGRVYRLTLVTVFALGLAVRVALVCAARPLLMSDARDYHDYARSLVEGRGYVQVYEGETGAFNGLTFRAFRPPGYPLFLAGLYTVCGWRLSAALAANVVSELVTQICFVLIAVQLLGRGGALVVQVLLTAHFVWTPSLMTESFYTALLAIVALQLVLGTAQRTMGGAVVCGVCVAAALATRPITVCVLPLLFWRAVRPRPSWHATIRLVLLMLPMALALAAWGARNYRIFGRVVLLTTNFGHHNAKDYGLDPDLAFAHYSAQGLNEAEIDAALTHDELHVAARRPLAWLVMYAGRVRDLLSPRPCWELRAILWPYTLPSGPRGSAIGWVYRAAYNQYYVIYILAGLGAILALAQRRRMGGLYGLVVWFIAIHAMISRGDSRLAAPLYPAMCVFAAVACVAIPEWLRRGAREGGVRSPFRSERGSRNLFR